MVTAGNITAVNREPLMFSAGNGETGNFPGGQVEGDLSYIEGGDLRETTTNELMLGELAFSDEMSSNLPF